MALTVTKGVPDNKDVRIAQLAQENGRLQALLLDGYEAQAVMYEEMLMQKALQLATLEAIAELYEMQIGGV